ncbi:NAD(P)-binding protein [Lentinus tigrinus ALCF2SS1-7]|uniref:NAD(P)-binding protein n=1 Tax=Lentinus tigrinus ALCF2SS1-6 TaxID=1328759 RepID=A0A5C2SN96_9APHY|nr:NAD(P)-binding protein [Lentinus tigrinus ALCF2SS1-6]RPD79318.1 NAD(P)-binding protein [Lentinus tigrinus ALCF2SS1-7]
MPAISSGKVLVTGANGFVAVWVLKDLLEHGFSVRSTVRTEGKSMYLRNLFAAHSSNFEVVVVNNMTTEGAFDEAVEGVDAILHLASPVILDSEDPSATIDPAVNGTLGILKSAFKHRATVRRVLILSSAAAIYNPPAPGQTGPRVLDERDWNEHSPKEVKEKGGKASGLDIYRTSKTFAERAAWRFVEDEKVKGGLEWDLVTLNPPFVYGPMMHQVATPDSLGSTPRMWYNHIVKGDLEGDALTKNGYAYVDVRDLARAHVLGLTVPEAGENRFMICAGSCVVQQFVDAARRVTDRIPAGEPSYKLEEAVYPTVYNAEKSKKVLRLDYRSLEETAEDTIRDFQSRGWVL